MLDKRRLGPDGFVPTGSSSTSKLVHGHVEVRANGSILWQLAHPLDRCRCLTGDGDLEPTQLVETDFVTIKRPPSPVQMLSEHTRNTVYAGVFDDASCGPRRNDMSEGNAAVDRPCRTDDCMRLPHRRGSEVDKAADQVGSSRPGRYALWRIAHEEVDRKGARVSGARDLHSDQPLHGQVVDAETLDLFNADATEALRGILAATHRRRCLVWWAGSDVEVVQSVDVAGNLCSEVGSCVIPILDFRV